MHFQSGSIACIVPDHYFQSEWAGLQTRNSHETKFYVSNTNTPYLVQMYAIICVLYDPAILHDCMSQILAYKSDFHNCQTLKSGQLVKNCCSCDCLQYHPVFYLMLGL